MRRRMPGCAATWWAVWREANGVAEADLKQLIERTERLFGERRGERQDDPPPSESKSQNLRFMTRIDTLILRRVVKHRFLRKPAQNGTSFGPVSQTAVFETDRPDQRHAIRADFMVAPATSRASSMACFTVSARPVSWSLASRSSPSAERSTARDGKIPWHPTYLSWIHFLQKVKAVIGLSG